MNRRRSTEFLLFYAGLLAPWLPWELCREIVALLVRLRQRRIDAMTLLAQAGDGGGLVHGLTLQECQRQTRSHYHVVFPFTSGLTEIYCPWALSLEPVHTVVLRDITLLVERDVAVDPRQFKFRIKDFRNPFIEARATQGKDRRNLHVTQWRKGVDYRNRPFWEEARIDISLDF